ncbi:MAG: hypothetical protein WAL45_11200, partial [Terracidiphilus sp.]
CDEKDAATKGPDDYEATPVKSHVWLFFSFCAGLQAFRTCGETHDNPGKQMRLGPVADKTADKNLRTAARSLFCRTGY